MVSNASSSCERIHGVATASNGTIFFTDRGARKVRVLHMETVRDVAGSGRNSSFDGSSGSCSFHQPTAICIEGNTLYVADTAVGRVCLVTPTSSLSKYLEQLDVVCKTFGIHLPTVPPETFSIHEAIEAVRGVSSSLSNWEKKIADDLGKGTSAVQGPQGVPSSKSIKSVELMLDSLMSLEKAIKYINVDYMCHVRLASLLTLVVEHLFSKMRSRNPTPTVLEYAYLFSPAMKENVKQLTETGFHYYTARVSFYELPEGGTLHFSDVPNIPQLPRKSMTSPDQRILRDWRDNYGQPVVQVTVRNQSTKDNVGTLPLYAYTKPQPKPQPLLFIQASHIPTTNGTDSTATSGQPSNDILFPPLTVLAVKPSAVSGSGIGEGQECPTQTSVPFYLGVTTVNIVQDQHQLHLPDIDIYLPSENDIFLFEKKFRSNVPKEAVKLVLRQLSPICDQLTLPLSEEIYEGLIEVFRDERDLCVEGLGVEDTSNGNESDDELLAAVCANSAATFTSVSTSRGRHIRPPQRLDL